MSKRLSPKDIETERFPTRVRGYGREEVRLYLRSIAEELHRVTVQNAEMREETGALREQLRQAQSREQTLQQTLVSAQKMAEELKLRAQEEAELTIREARIRSERLLEQSQDQLARIEDEIRRAKLERDAFENRLRGAVEEHLSLLELRQSDRSELDNVRYLHRNPGAEAAG
jgi:cell division initiation protein